jgi:integrase
MASFGNVQKTGKRSWKLTVSGGFDGGGKRIKHTKTVRVTSDNLDTQEKEARQQLALFHQEIERGVVTSGKLKIKDFAIRWFTEYCEKKLAPKTQKSYKLHLEKRIIPAMGNIYITKLKPLQIIEFLNNLTETGLRIDGKEGTLGDETIMYCYRVLSSMLHDATEWQIIVSNPCDRVKPPTVKKHIGAGNSYNEAQTLTMLVALQNEPLKYHIIILLALVSGLRRGELCGIEWQDIDLQENLLTVNRASQSLSGLGTFSKAPKNYSSNRTITIPQGIIPLLKEFKAWQNEERLQLGDKWHSSDRLLTKWNGLPMHVDTPSKWFRKFLNRYNDSIDNDKELTKEQKQEKKLPIIRFHDLRHTSGSLLIAKGIPLKNVSSRLGHVDIRTTGNIYSHALQSVDKQASNIMNDIIFQKENQAIKKGQTQ